ncbi:putative fructokinase-2 [Raphanus sativus]|nr:putative fructokinase-2 [Raphanus sativus]
MTSKALNHLFTLLNHYINYTNLRSLIILSIIFVLRSLEHKLDLVPMSSNVEKKGLIVSFGEMLIDFVPRNPAFPSLNLPGFSKLPEVLPPTSPSQSRVSVVVQLSLES